MLFWLKKAVSFWLMPLPLCVALMAAGLLLLRSTRWPKAGPRLLIAGWGLLFLLSNKQVGQALLRPLESQYAAQPELPAGSPLPAPLAACRAIVVLGGGHTDQAGLSALNQLSASSLFRLAEGVRLARSVPDATLIVSGPGAGKNSPTHASVLAAAAVSLGIDPRRIVQIDTARDTGDVSLAHAPGDGPHAAGRDDPAALSGGHGLAGQRRNPRQRLAVRSLRPRTEQLGHLRAPGHGLGKTSG